MNPTDESSTPDDDLIANYLIEIEEKYQAMRRSRSWRLTAPLRYLMRLTTSEDPLTAAELTEQQSIERERLYALRRGRIDVQNLRTRLLTLGFVEKALGDLKAVANHDAWSENRRQAALELAVWYLELGTEEGAREALNYLPLAASGEDEAAALRRISILKAEAYQRLGWQGWAKKDLLGQQERQEHCDVCLALANLEECSRSKLQCINAALGLCGLDSLKLADGDGTAALDQLRGGACGRTEGGFNDQPLISVIMPAYNSADTIATAIQSVLTQSWRNLELLIVNDCSTDDTSDVLMKFVEADPRARLIKADKNAGTYVARNLGLNEARGKFVTCHDADDWSHPQKIELQVRKLMENQSTIANMTEQARAYSDLIFDRRGRPGSFVFPNFSSLMFRRVPVQEKLGYWDSVRFGADSEFIRRLRLVFGSDSVKILEDSLLSFQRRSGGSLTGSKKFGYHGFFVGARYEYFSAQSHYYENQNDLKYSFPQLQRPFPIPRPMSPSCSSQERAMPRHFDVVVVSDFRTAGESMVACIEECKAQSSANLRTGLVMMHRYDHLGTGTASIHPKIRALLQDPNIELIVFGEKITCDLALIRHPSVLQHKQCVLPEIDAPEIRVIVDQTPLSDYREQGELNYSVGRCSTNVVHHFGRSGRWHPITPAIRAMLIEHHADEMDDVELSDVDWMNIINIEDWFRGSRPKPGRRPRIGRHAKDIPANWPETSELIGLVYPSSNAYDVQILGGATVPKSLLGQLPSTWTVLDFDDIPVREFLKTLDVFVYNTHPNAVGTCSRPILQAMAAGVPTILPPEFERVFGDGALYAEPSGVLATVEKLMADSDVYDTQVRKAQARIRTKHSYASHIARIGKSSASRQPAGAIGG